MYDTFSFDVRHSGTEQGFYLYHVAIKIILVSSYSCGSLMFGQRGDGYVGLMSGWNVVSGLWIRWQLYTGFA